MSIRISKKIVFYQVHFILSADRGGHFYEKNVKNLKYVWK